MAAADELEDKPGQLDPIPGSHPHHHPGENPGAEGLEPHHFEPIEIPAPLLGGSTARNSGAQTAPATPRSVMRQNLINAGRLAPDDPRQAHHIVPQGGPMNGDRNPRPAQRQLEKFGIALNTIENGLGLSPDFHRRLHTTRYYDYVNEQLRRTSTTADAQQRLREIRDRLVRENDTFDQTGHMPTWDK